MSRAGKQYIPANVISKKHRDLWSHDKERINCVLAQFAQFYETYDVDPESPFYVPEKSRLPVF